MALLNNIKCGHCKFSFTGGYRYAEGNKYIGPQFVKCPRCSKYNRTSANSYSLMSKSTKRNHWLWVAYNTSVRAFINGLLVIFPLFYFFPDDTDWNLSIWGVSIVLLFIFFMYRTYNQITNELIPEIEKENNTPEIKALYKGYLQRLEEERKQREILMEMGKNDNKFLWYSLLLIIVCLFIAALLKAYM